ncbi:MAG: cation transporter [Ferruginibacter sp.]
MIHKYKVSGMTCSGCQAKVQSLLLKVPGVRKVDIDLAGGETTVDMDHHVDTLTLKESLKDHPKYQLSEINGQKTTPPQSFSLLQEKNDSSSWFTTYKPILLIFGYILLITFLVEIISGSFISMRWMNNFMAGFFLTFSFFKLLNVNGFAESYAMYDIVAKRLPWWGYLYVFVELGLGIAYLTGFEPFVTNIVTLTIMSVSLVGVVQSVLNKRKIKCACLGDVFNLPMSTITITEDLLMIAMSAGMVLMIITT